MREERIPSGAEGTGDLYNGKWVKGEGEETLWIITGRVLRVRCFYRSKFRNIDHCASGDKSMRNVECTWSQYSTNMVPKRTVSTQWHNGKWVMTIRPSPLFILHALSPRRHTREFGKWWESRADLWSQWVKGKREKENSESMHNYRPTCSSNLALGVRLW